MDVVVIVVMGMMVVIDGIGLIHGIIGIIGISGIARITRVTGSAHRVVVALRDHIIRRVARCHRRHFHARLEFG